MKKPNLIFYTLCFLYTTTLCSVLILGTFEPNWWLKIYFLAYALLQSIVEISLLALVGYGIQKELPSWSFKIYLGAFFIYLLARFVDFIMIRLMDQSILYAFKIFFLSGWTHFFASMRAMNLNPTMIVIIVGAILFSPFLGNFLYKGSQKLSRRSLSPKLLLANVFGISLVLFALDSTLFRSLNLESYLVHQKKLPLKFTYLRPKGPIIALTGAVKKGKGEEWIENIQLEAKKKPLIFLFVVETLREDFITEQTAPCLAGFRKENGERPITYSNANGSHLSWYSIFFSSLPHHWPYHKERSKEGSPSLQILKKMGYQVHLLTSADLEYYQMADMLFGKQRQALTTSYDYNVKWPMNPEIRDQKAIEDLISKINNLEEPEGHAFLVFLDSTHSEYCWKKDFPIVFEPITDKVHYLKMIHTKEEIPLLQNRYRNSIHYIDFLFEKFVGALKEKGFYNNSMIAFTGDHGEEFFEEGALFHGTHLNDLQTRVPIYYHFPTQKQITRNLTSHIDIFPTFFDVITENPPTFFDGFSLFDSTAPPYTYCFMQNGGGTPREFFLHNGSCKFCARFSDSSVYKSTEIEVLFVKKEEQKTHLSQKELEQFLSENFNGALQEICEIDGQSGI